MLHTLEDFCRFVWPHADEATLRRRYFWLAGLEQQRQRKKCYHELLLPRKNGPARRILAPSEPLKQVQRAIVSLLADGEISVFAAAYRKGCGIRGNALPHVGQPLVVKLDIRDFFGSIRFPAVFSAVDRALRRSPLAGTHYLNAYDRAEPDPLHYNRVLSHYFTAFCTLDGALVQGAPTSPLLSNLVFAPLDARIGAYCEKHGIVYTRYSDDMTFSGAFNPHALTGFAAHLLAANGFALNTDKKAVLGRGFRQKVTGVVVNETPQAGRDYRRKIRQEMHYIRTYGIESHLRRLGEPSGRNQAAKALGRLAGRVAFVLQLRPDDKEFCEYRALCAALLSDFG